jgi:DNA modification methylase
MTIRILVGDCRETMATMEPDSVDAIVTDPPYLLSFMSKSWDTSGEPRAMQAWHETWAREAYRVLKPGGHMLAFGGTRTSHRMVCAIEDAGFEIRDTLCYMYGSGFPKSLDVSKAIDKAAGAEREVVGVRSYPRDGTTPVTRKATTIYTNGDEAENVGQDSNMITAPATDLARRWDGWGTALKPAYEPIVMARKPLIGSVAVNVARYGTGGINVDGCRIATNGEEVPYFNTKGGEKFTINGEAQNVRQAGTTTQGRWPANVLLDADAAALLDAQSGERKSGGAVSGFEPSPPTQNAYGEYHRVAFTPFTDTGGASRFFYTAKASRAERNKGLDGMPEEYGYRENGFSDKISHTKIGRANHHPTVKPLDLMQWLCRLVTPPGGTVLDCFCGSGTTLIAADREGFDAIGIEQDAEYAAIARRRCIGDAPLFAQVAD